MDHFPLSPFLESLASDGILVGSRDCERIGIVMQTGGDWHLTRLKDVLISLLSTNIDQQEIIERRLNEFFEANLDAEKLWPDLNVGTFMSNLRLLEEGLLQPSDIPPKPAITLEVQSPVSVSSSASNIDLRLESSIDDQLELPEPEAEKRQDAASEIEDQADNKIEPTWDDSASRHFSLALIGGKPSPRIEDAALNHIADSMGYFLAEQPGNRLDMVASAKKTAEQCGIVSLRFSRRKKLRSLVILEDAFAEPREWNPIATELAEGMLARGVSVLHGRFYGAAEQFKTEDGATYRIEDLEDEREGLLLLLFTDGKSFCRSEQRFDLERLARWPWVAWMELREHRFWDESAEIPVRHRIPVYPATSLGIEEAMKGFLTESGPGKDFSAFATSPSRKTNLATSKLGPYVECLLGDALPWAQDCAMAVQPVSRGMADTLRKKFHPWLPPERIGRLHMLPDTEYNRIGLRFSDDVLKVLRQGFMARRLEKDQDHILQFILEKVAECEPTEKSGLAHMTWESVKERVRLECEMNADLQRLVELSKTPLAGFIRRSLEDFGSLGQTDKIPLRVKTESRHATQMLDDIPELFSDRNPADRMEFVFIEPGKFFMGSPVGEVGRRKNEKRHLVSITEGFFIQKTPVTQKQWKKLMGYNPSRFRENGDNHPVENVSWIEVQKFIAKLNEKEKTDKYRFPTEAEWEYSCRSGRDTPFSFGESDMAAQYANIDTMGTSEVASFPPNAWGVHDMHGNVWEWCQDWIADYTPILDVDPRGPENGSVKVIRGGSWENKIVYSRSACRGSRNVKSSFGNLGFRLCY